MSNFWGTAVFARLADQLFDRVIDACMPDSMAGQMLPAFSKTDVYLSQDRFVMQRRLSCSRSMQMNNKGCLRT